MPNPNESPDIQLTVTATPPPQGSGGWRYENVNGIGYWYKYTGGDDGNGNLEVSVSGNHGKGPRFTNVYLNPYAGPHDPEYRRFEVARCVIDPNDDQKQQLTWQHNGKYGGKLKDMCDQIATAYYKLVAIDTQNGSCEIVCDPGVNNKSLLVHFA